MYSQKSPLKKVVSGGMLIHVKVLHGGIMFMVGVVLLEVGVFILTDHSKVMCECWNVILIIIKDVQIGDIVKWMKASVVTCFPLTIVI